MYVSLGDSFIYSLNLYFHFYLQHSQIFFKKITEWKNNNKNINKHTHTHTHPTHPHTHTNTSPSHSVLLVCKFKCTLLKTVKLFIFDLSKFFFGNENQNLQQTWIVKLDLGFF